VVDEPHDAVALLAADTVTDGVDDARDLHPGDVRRLGTALVVPAALHDVREVDAGGLHLDAEFASVRLGLLGVLYLDGAAAPKLCYLSYAHGFTMVTTVDKPGWFGATRNGPRVVVEGGAAEPTGDDGTDPSHPTTYLFVHTAQG
jgi:hypothetical protein